MITLKGIDKEKRTIAEIIIKYIWNTFVELIIVEIPYTPKEVIPDMLHNIARFFNLEIKNALY